MNNKVYLLGLAVLISSFASANMNNHDYTERSGPPSEKQFTANGQKDSNLPGITFLRPVLSGVLYRSGIGNKKKGLTNSQLDDLCQAGFSTAMIVDFKDGKPRTQKCANGTIKYIRVSSRKKAETALEVIYQAIKADKGPIMAHCRNGVHASNVISAKALVRFCGWSIEEAKDYWEATRNQSPCSPNCNTWIDKKFSGFKSGENGMPLTSAQKASFCPNP